MIVLLNENGFVESYAEVGTLVDGIEVPAPEDMEHFEAHFSAYGISDGVLIFDAEQETLVEEERAEEEIRTRREKECFPVINRGQLWYSRLTEEQKAELDTWYQAWLDAPDTRIIPEPLDWV